MKMKVISWESEGLRCPDVAVEIGQGDQCPRVFLLQMPNGTGKTTTLTMIRAALTGEARQWDTDTVRKFRRAGNTNPSGKFILKLSIDGKPLTFEIQLDFIEGIAKYRTTWAGAGGIQPDWSPPSDIRRFLKKEFVSLFIFDGELAERLLDHNQSEAEKAIDALCQLYLLDDLAGWAESDWQKVTKRPGPKTQVGLNDVKNKEDLLVKQIQKVTQIKSGALKRIAELSKEIKHLDETIGAQLKQIEGDQEELQKLKIDELQKEAVVDKVSVSLMSALRQPHLLHPAFFGALGTLKLKLDKAKLPESSSKQFFIELADEPLCVCGRPIGNEERRSIVEHASKYLGESIAGVLNALKADIDSHVNNADTGTKMSVATIAGDLKHDVSSWHQARAARDAHESGLRQKGGEKLQEQNELLTKLRHEKKETEDLLEEEIDRRPKPDDDEKTRCLAALNKQLEETRKRIAEISGTVELRKKTDVIKGILSQAKLFSRDSLRAVLVQKCNERLEKVLSRDPVRLDNISRSLTLHNQDGASVGQTLAVGYTFLTNLLDRGAHEFPLIVDSPANPIDNNVRREIGALIPELCKQFVALTISSEREGFVPALEKGAKGDIRYVTMFRATKGTEALLRDIPEKGISKTKTAVLIAGKDYFNKFDMDDEPEEK